jgi:hypothetical protein
MFGRYGLNPEVPWHWLEVIRRLSLELIPEKVEPVEVIRGTILPDGTVKRGGRGTRWDARTVALLRSRVKRRLRDNPDATVEQICKDLCRPLKKCKSAAERKLTHTDYNGERITLASGPPKSLAEPYETYTVGPKGKAVAWATLRRIYYAGK